MPRKARFNIIPGHNIELFEPHGMGKKTHKQIKVESNEKRWVKNYQPQTEGHARAAEIIDSNDVSLVVGPAGSGKTKLAVAKALQVRREGKVNKIILCRPAVEAGEKLGFLPGDLKEKVDPYMRPLYDALLEDMSSAQLKIWMDEDVIEIAPLAFMQGRTLKNAFIIVDEAQNATRMQLEMVVTRLGFGSKMVLTGDPNQSVLLQGQSGLRQICNELRDVEGVGIAHLDEVDIVRHPTVRAICAALKIR